MDSIRAHPYRAALVAAVILILVGALIVYRRSDAPTTASSSAWGSTGSLFDPQATPNASAPEQSDANRGARDVPLYQYRPPAFEEDSEGAFDFDAFVAALSRPDSAGEPASGGTESAASTYSFIPTGLISTDAPSTQRSQVEELIYQYGNEVGEYIELYESTHRNNAAILKNQIEDRGNAEKAAAVRSIGADLRALGTSIERIETVPDIFSHAQGALADSYIEAGGKLAAVADANGDQAFIAAINSYNAAAESLIKNYVAMATLFSVNNIRFKPADAGRVFMFSGQ
jgi:hypothetical protein